MTLEECAAGGPEQGLEEGGQDDAGRDFARSVMQDINLCVVQGKREQLRLQAEARFGTPAGQRLYTWLRLEDDPQRLDEIAVLLVRSETADELLHHLSPNGLDGLPQPPDLTLEELARSVREWAAGWPDQWACEDERRAKEHDVDQCILRGKRVLLRCLAAERFGWSMGDHLYFFLQREEDSRRLDEIGKAMFRYETPDEFLWWLTPVPIPLATARPPSAAKRPPKPAA